MGKNDHAFKQQNGWIRDNMLINYYTLQHKLRELQYRMDALLLK